MTILYDKNITIQVGDDTDQITIPTTFKIVIDIQHIISGTSNSGTVKIFNLSEETKEFIRDKAKRIRIYGGYSGVSTLIHDGQILYSTSLDNAADRVSVLYLGGQAYKINNASFSKSYQGVISFQDIVKDALPTFGVPYNERIINTIPSSATANNFSFLGKTRNLIDTLLNPLGIQFFERNNELLLSKVGAVTADQQGDIEVLNSTTGLIKTAVQSDRGINVISLLNPLLQVGKIVKIESDVIDFSTYIVPKMSDNTVGFYKIIQANYTGDNYDGKFQALLRCVPYS